MSPTVCNVPAAPGCEEQQNPLAAVHEQSLRALSKISAVHYRSVLSFVSAHEEDTGFVCPYSTSHLKKPQSHMYELTVNTVLDIYH